MQISKLQFISNYQSERPHLDQIAEAVKGGVTWVQYRPKDVDKAGIVKEGGKIASFCRKNGVVFIMNDHVEIAKEINADGVHLGKNDMSPIKAREILGNDKIIGGTSNTTEDIITLIKQGVNYVGLGPFRFTSTKKNLSPILGLKGYSTIVKELKNKAMSIPIIAIGGIKEEDIKQVLNTGVHGIAISSLISEAETIKEKTKNILQLIK